ncbi:MAG TPA: hypothetical protein VFB22_06980 [Candidatus Baltobacteraceae bacterium]|nr:hypothetical protein [Candidatus Baltobacteraceae bacterium]
MRGETAPAARADEVDAFPQRIAASATRTLHRHAGLVAGASTFAAIALLTGLSASAMNNYTLLADAWLHGRAWVVPGGPYIDAVPWHGHPYVIEAPLPAVLMLPLAALSGTAANQNLVCAVLAAIAVAATLGLARNVTGSARSGLALAAFAAFGTSLFAGALDGGVWFMAHVSAFAFTVLALVEMTGKRRGWLVGIFAACAGLSRYPLLPVVAIYVGWLAMAGRRRSALACALAVCAFAVPWVAYNELRWGTLHDPGFTIWYHVMDPRSHGGLPPFSLANLPMQLEAYFQRPPHLLDRFPWIAPPMFGFAITWSSFGLVLALLTLPRIPRDVSIAMLWLAMLVAAIPGFLYYDTGGVEYGMRHALDFEPFAIALVAFALRTPWSALTRPLLYANAGFGLYETLLFALSPPTS